MKTILEQENIEENKELLDLIKEDFYRIKPINCNDFFKRRDKRIPCLPALQKKFNGATYNDILQIAGVDDTELHFVRRNREEILSKLRYIISNNNYIPSSVEVCKYGVCRETIIKEFGSWKKAIKEAVNKDIQLRKLVNVKETNEELLEMYIEFSNKIGKGDIGASGIDLNESQEIYNAGVFMLRFAGMNQLRSLAGFPPQYNRRIINSKENITQILTEKIIRKGRFLTATEISEDKELPALATILKYFRNTKLSEVNKEILQNIKEKDIELYKMLIKK